MSDAELFQQEIFDQLKDEIEGLEYSKKCSSHMRLCRRDKLGFKIVIFRDEDIIGKYVEVDDEGKKTGRLDLRSIGKLTDVKCDPIKVVRKFFLEYNNPKWKDELPVNIWEAKL